MSDKANEVLGNVEVILGDLQKHPKCTHGPTLLFRRAIKDGKRSFYACSAYRDRRKCSFFLWEDELDNFRKSKEAQWLKRAEDVRNSIKTSADALIPKKVAQMPQKDRIYCHVCARFILDSKNDENHTSEHEITKNISDSQFGDPSTILRALDNTKEEAQYFFSAQSVQLIVDIVQSCNYRKVICIGAPTIYNYIRTNLSGKIKTILMDIDKRYLNFYSENEFCCYNVFNHYFFTKNGASTYERFIANSKPDEILIVFDPPFGGRVEPLVQTLEIMGVPKVALLWAFPYFMESHLQLSMPFIKMLDYRLTYKNHVLFGEGQKSRKLGSPVRLFTNIPLSNITLPCEEGYKYCNSCEYWVSLENNHCEICKTCTSKDGRTWQHCNLCERCVKPTWQHCPKCKRCHLPKNPCGDLPTFTQQCFHCKKDGHKKRECPKVNRDEVQKKRKLGQKFKFPKYQKKN